MINNENYKFSDLIKSEGFGQGIGNYAKSRGIDPEEIRFILSDSINSAFKNIKDFEDYYVEFLPNNTLKIFEGESKINDIELGNFYNHFKHLIEKNAIVMFKELQYKKLINKIDYQNKIYNSEVIRIGVKNIVCELTDLYNMEVIVDNTNIVRKDRLKIGDKIKLILLENSVSLKDLRCTGSRKGEIFVRLLLKEFIPEIQEGAIEISSVTRLEGIKCYIIVRSINKFINAAKAIIGSKGSRINDFKNHLPERIEIVEYSDSYIDFLRKIFKDKIYDLDIISEDKISFKIDKIGTNSFPFLEIDVFKKHFPEIKLEWLFKEEEKE